MKFKGHFFWTTIYMMIWFFCMGIYNPIILVLGSMIIAFLSTFPDIDLAINKSSHRFIWIHSILFPTIGLFYFMSFPLDNYFFNIFFVYFCFFLVLAFGHHLALDTVGNIIFKKKAIGFYTLCLFPSITFNFLLFKIKTRSVRVGGSLTTILLLTNFIISIIIGMWWVLV